MIDMLNRVANENMSAITRDRSIHIEHALKWMQLRNKMKLVYIK